MTKLAKLTERFAEHRKRERLRLVRQHPLPLPTPLPAQREDGGRNCATCRLPLTATQISAFCSATCRNEGLFGTYELHGLTLTIPELAFIAGVSFAEMSLRLKVLPVDQALQHRLEDG
jgi:hypothetical protein